MVFAVVVCVVFFYQVDLHGKQQGQGFSKQEE